MYAREHTHIRLLAWSALTNPYKHVKLIKRMVYDQELGILIYELLAMGTRYPKV